MVMRGLAVLLLSCGVAGCSGDEEGGATLASVAGTQVLRVTTDAISETSATNAPRRLIVDLRDAEPDTRTCRDCLGPDVCPTFNARASVNGIELPLAHAGQRAAVNTGDMGGYYECQGPRFELDLEEHADMLAERVVEVTVRDESAAFRTTVVNLFHELELDWGENIRSRILRSGDTLTIVVEPAPEPREHDAAIRFVYPAMPGSLFELRSERNEVRVTARGVEFVIPELNIEATLDGLLQAEGAALATGISTCDGPRRCTVAGRNMRWLPEWRSVAVAP